MSSNLTQAQIDHYLSLSEEEWKIALSSLDNAAKLLLYEAKYQKLAAISQQKDQQLSANDQQLNVKDQLIAAKDQQLNVIDQQLILKDQELAKEKELALKMFKEHQEEIKQLELRFMLSFGYPIMRRK